MSKVQFITVMWIVMTNNYVNSDNNNARKLNTVDKDTNLSEQTLIGISVKSDHEDDKSDANEASTAPLDVSQVTLTGSTVNIAGMTSGIHCVLRSDL